MNMTSPARTPITMDVAFMRPADFAGGAAAVLAFHYLNPDDLTVNDARIFQPPPTLTAPTRTFT